MSFYIYDMGGDRIRYEMGMDWRSVKKSDEVFPSLEKSKEKEEKHRDMVATTIEKEVHVPKSVYAPATPLLASQIMKRPVVTLLPETTLKDAWELISHRRFRHVPIVTKEGKLMGIISDRTLLRETSYFNPALEPAANIKTVKDVMVTKVLTARPETEVSHIAKVFIDEKVGGMPIVNEKGLVVGMLTRSDILRTLVKVSSFDIRI